MSKELFEISRRRLLAGLGTVGVASAGAGLGTTAYFSDREEFDGNSLVAGELDMKVSYEEHYSDWSEDEGDGVNVSMTNVSGYDGILGDNVGPVWVNNTTAFQQNTLNNNASDGEPLEFDPTTVCEPPGETSNDDPAAHIDIGDVKPGDFGEVTFDFTLCSNPGYVWVYGDLVDASENGKTEPEMDDPDEMVNGTNTTGDPSGLSDDYVELLDALQVIVWRDTDGDNVKDPAETVVAGPASLREFLANNSFDSTAGRFGVPIAGNVSASAGGGTGRNCFSAAPDVHNIGFGWWLPVDHANEIQTDSVEFDLGFYTEQCRHNDGSGQNASDINQTPS